MNPQTAIIIDDLAADRQLAALSLRRAGWTVHLARDSKEGSGLIEKIKEEDKESTIIITDLNMPNDPSYKQGERQASAGAQFALRLRARMERQELPRLPIVALTALTEREIYLTALAFGCDAVLSKPATPDLAKRVVAALAVTGTENAEMIGAGPLLSLLRCKLAESIEAPSMPSPLEKPLRKEETRLILSEQDITRALLAYRRTGLVGLGESNLAQRLAPQQPSLIKRGEHAYKILLSHLDEVMRLGASEALAVLKGELVDQASPNEQASELGLSLSEYYRRRQEAIAVLLDLLGKEG